MIKKHLLLHIFIFFMLQLSAIAAQEITVKTQKIRFINATTHETKKTVDLSDLAQWQDPSRFIANWTVSSNETITDDGTVTKGNISLCYINDTHGHIEGDRALATFANILTDTLRESDLVARIGGDEFAALLLDTPQSSAVDVIARLQKRIDEYNHKSTRDYKLDFSFGVVDFDPDCHLNVEALLADGDSLMYECKQKKG